MKAKMYAELMRKKRCTSCNEEKDVSEFYTRKISNDGIAPICKVCDNKKSTEYRNRNKDKIRAQRKDFRIKNKERLSIAKNRAKATPEQFKSLFEEQKGCCAICKIHQIDLKRRIAVDHNHESGQIRGLLCDTCNRGLGLLKENIEVLQKAVEYLIKYKK